MKRIIIYIIQIMVFSVVSLFPQERVSVVNDQLIFYIPTSTILEPLPPESMSSRERGEFYSKLDKENDNKVTVWPWGIMNENNLLNDNFNRSPGIENLKRNNKLKQQDFLSLLKPNQSHFAFYNTNWGYLKGSQILIKYNGIFIGELIVADSTEDVVAPYYYGYLLGLVVGDNIINIRLKLFDWKRILAEQMPNYFYYENQSYKNYLWRDMIKSREELYRKLNSANYNEFPELFQKLRETLDMILNTMIINCYEKKEFYITETALRLRSNADTSSDIVETIPKGSQVKLLEEGNVQIIDGIAAKWVRVETENGKQGWCFSGYLKP